VNIQHASLFLGTTSSSSTSAHGDASATCLDLDYSSRRRDARGYRPKYGFDPGFECPGAKITQMTGSKPLTDRFDVRVTAEGHFAWLRTRMSVERTLMAWIRTAVSLIGFGFTIVQFFNRLPDMPGNDQARFPQAPYYLGLALIGCGVLATAVAILQYRWTLRYLWGGSFAEIAGMSKEGLQTPVLAVTGLLFLIGVFAFIAVLLHFV
jgi:putative membrane protein